MIDRYDVEEFAIDNGYDGAKETDVIYNGYKVWEPTFKGSGTCFTGYPLVILVKGDDIRLSTEDESLEILSIMYPNEDEEEW